MNINRRNLLKIIAISGLNLPLNRPAFARKDTKGAIIFPPRLRPGDMVGLVSPAGITRSPEKVKIIEETLNALDLRLSVDAHAMDLLDAKAGMHLPWIMSSVYCLNGKASNIQILLKQGTT